MQEQEQELHPCLVTYGECLFGEQCLFTSSPRDACIYYLKGKCTHPRQSQCTNGRHYQELAKTIKEAQAALYASGTAASIKLLPKKVWRPHNSHGWKVGGLFCTRCGTGLTTPEAKVKCVNAPADYKEEEPTAETEQTSGTEEKPTVNTEKAGEAIESSPSLSAQIDRRRAPPCDFLQSGVCLAERCSYSHITGERVKSYRDRSERRGPPWRERDERDYRERSRGRDDRGSFQTFNFERYRDSGFVTHDLEGDRLQSGKTIRRNSRGPTREFFDDRDYIAREEYRPRDEQHVIDEYHPRELLEEYRPRELLDEYRPSRDPVIDRGGPRPTQPRVEILPAILF